MPVLKVLIPNHSKREFDNLLAGFKHNPNRREYKSNVKKRILDVGDNSTIYLLSGDIVSLKLIQNKIESFVSHDSIVFQSKTHNIRKDWLILMLIEIRFRDHTSVCITIWLTYQKLKIKFCLPIWEWTNWKNVWIIVTRGEYMHSLK